MSHIFSPFSIYLSLFLKIRATILKPPITRSVTCTPTTYGGFHQPNVGEGARAFNVLVEANRIKRVREREEISSEREAKNERIVSSD